jgi:predicted dehydrogenase
MNFGIIGFGNIAKKFIHSISYTNNGTIYAIASRSLKPDDSFLLEHPQIKCYPTYDELLNDSTVEAVYIALPHQQHKEWAIKALRHHIPVLCEKPAALSVLDMREIAATAISQQTYFLEAFKTKFNVGMDQLKKDIRLIGPLTKLEANFCSDSVFRVSPDSYLLDPVQGGALNDVGSYGIGFMLDLIPDQLVDVRANRFIKNGIDYHTEMQLFFEQGTMAHLECAIDRKKERTAFIYGANGSIEVPLFNRITEYTIALSNGTRQRRSFPIQGDDMVLEIQAIIDDVTQQRLENLRHSMDDSCEIIKIMELVRNAAPIVE